MQEYQLQDLRCCLTCKHYQAGITVVSTGRTAVSACYEDEVPRPTLWFGSGSPTQRAALAEWHDNHDVEWNGVCPRYLSKQDE